MLQEDEQKIRTSLRESYLDMLKEYSFLEGSVNYMYLDTKGLVTIGLGHLLASPDQALKIPFIKRNSHFAPNTDKPFPWFEDSSSKGYRSEACYSTFGRTQSLAEITSSLNPPYTSIHQEHGKANSVEIEKAYRWVKSQKMGKNRAFYKNPVHNNIMISDDVVDNLARNIIDTKILQLENEIGKKTFLALDKNAQLGLLDISYNVGSIFGFKKLIKAVRSSDWSQAALHSHRRIEHDAKGRPINVGTLPRNTLVATLFCQLEQSSPEPDKAGLCSDFAEVLRKLKWQSFEHIKEELKNYSSKMIDKLNVIDALFSLK